MSIFRPEYCLGIYISRHQVVGVLAEQGGEFIKPVHLYMAKNNQDMFSTQNLELLEHCLGQVLDEFNAEFKGQYIPLQISLADPLVKSAVFDLDVLPSQSKARDELIRWRFDKDCHIDMDQMSVAWQSMASEQGQQQIYALTAGSDVIRTISDACQQRGLMLNVLDAAVNYHFNDFYTSMVDSASLLQLNQEYWTLMAWDRKKRIRYVRSKWFRSNHDQRAEELKLILLDVERLLHSFIETSEDRLSMLYIEPSIHDRSLLQEALAERMDNNFTFLDQQNSVVPDRDADNAYTMAALAARCR